MNRQLTIGDTIVIKPDAVEALEREGYRNVKARVPAKILGTWMQGKRRVFSLDIDCEHVSGIKSTVVWADQVRLADSTVERQLIATEKRVAKMVAAKQAREAARRIPKRRRPT